MSEMSERHDHNGLSRGLVSAAPGWVRSVPARNELHSPGEPQQGFSARVVFHALQQWWKLALPAGVVLAAVAVFAVNFFFVRKYEAFAWLSFSDQAPGVALTTRDDSRKFVEDQVQLIRSPLVAAPVVNQEEIARLPEVASQNDPAMWLQKKIKVDQRGSSSIFTISFQSTDPKAAELIVRAVTDTYFKFLDEQETKRLRRITLLLDGIRNQRTEDVRRLRERVKTLTQQATGKDPFAPKTGVEQAEQSPLGALLGQLAATEISKEILSAKIESLKKRADDQNIEVPEAEIEQAVEESPEVVAVKRSIEAMRLKINTIAGRSSKGTDDPACLRLQKEIDYLENGPPDKDVEKANGEKKSKDPEQGNGEKKSKGLQAIREKVKDRIKIEMEAAMRIRRRADESQLKDAIMDVSVTEKALRDRCDKLREELAKGRSGETLELEFARDELKRAQDLVNLYAKRIVEQEDRQKAPARVELYQEPQLPRDPIEASPWKTATLAGLALFFLPFALAVGWERVVRRVSDADRLEEDVHVAVLGEIARLPARTSISRRTNGRLGQNLRVFEESIDSLRTCLILAEDLKDLRVLAVTSATNSEGKTSVAAQLTVSIARAMGQPILLIDGDMRAPDVHKVFEIELEPGLAKVLAHECSLDEAIVTAWSPYVHLLPAGRLESSPHKLLGDGAWRAVLQEVAARYRYIVIDTPPILAASEALVLAKAADASLLCAMRNVSRVDQVRRACERLRTSGCRTVGMVLNGVPARHYGYRYGDYSYTTS